MARKGGKIVPWIDMDEFAERDRNAREKPGVGPYAGQRRAGLRFYADETIPTQALGLLRKRGFDVIAARGAEGGGLPAQNQLAFARTFARILVTCDEYYLDQRNCPTTTTPTVMVFGFGDGTADEILSAFQCLDYMASGPRFYDNWCKIHAQPGEWTEHVRPAYGTSSSRRFRWQEGRLQTWAEE
jgi:hypothetical protein